MGQTSTPGSQIFWVDFEIGFFVFFEREKLGLRRELGRRPALLCVAVKRKFLTTAAGVQGDGVDSGRCTAPAYAYDRR